MSEGGYTDISFTGVARNVWHCDVASLYPSIMLAFDCFPASDRLQIFRSLLTDLRKFRLEAKGEMRAAKEAKEQHHLEALQNRFKIWLKAFYGYLDFTKHPFTDLTTAPGVTQPQPDTLWTLVEA